MVHCAACGGKLAAKAAACEYCGCEVAPRDRDLGPACPECFARLSKSARFCWECGVAIQPETLRVLASEAGCPRCNEHLAEVEAANGRYTECPSCGGIWLDAKLFEAAVEKRDLQALGSIIPSSTRSPVEELPNEVRYLPCPACKQMMNRKNFAACSGVIVDWCRKHGYWFDVHELEKVIAFVSAGGLDKARQFEVSRQKEQIAQLESRKRIDAGLGSPVGAPGNFGFGWVDVLSVVFRGLRRL